MRTTTVEQPTGECLTAGNQKAACPITVSLLAAYPHNHLTACSIGNPTPPTSVLTGKTVGNLAAHHMHIFPCAHDEKRNYSHLLHPVARQLFPLQLAPNNLEHRPCIHDATGSNTISHGTETGTLAIAKRLHYPRLDTQPPAGRSVISSGIPIQPRNLFGKEDVAPTK